MKTNAAVTAGVLAVCGLGGCAIPITSDAERAGTNTFARTDTLPQVSLSDAIVLKALKIPNAADSKHTYPEIARSAQDVMTFMEQNKTALAREFGQQGIELKPGFRDPNPSTATRIERMREDLAFLKQVSGWILQSDQHRLVDMQMLYSTLARIHDYGDVLTPEIVENYVHELRKASK